ncbi:MAG: sulfatase-like hydrolase/transferase [Halobacteriaceae archaeon]
MRNVLLLLGSQHGHRWLGADDGPHAAPVETPALSALADEGTTFEAAYTPTPLDGPARAGLLTGRRPADVGVVDSSNPFPDVPTLADRFGAAGYDTCLVGSLGLAGRRQFAGFDARPYGDLTGTGGGQLDPLTDHTARGSPYNAWFSKVGGEYGHRYDPMDPDRVRPDPWRSLAGDAGQTHVPESATQPRAVAREAVAHVRDAAAAGDDPWFLTASFAAPRPPLTAPDRHLDRYDGAPDPAVGADSDAGRHPLSAAKREADRTAELRDEPTVDLDDETVREARRACFARVSHLDEVIGDLLGDLRRGGHLEDTVVVYAAGSGNLAGEHGLWWNAAFQEGALRVPLVVSTPAQRRGDAPAGAVEAPVSLLDVAPTLSGLVGVDAPGGDGADLSAAVTGGADPDRGPVRSELLVPRYGEGTEFQVVRDGDRKLVAVRDGPDLLFDLDADPLERTDRLDDDPDAAAALRRRGDVDLDAAVAAREDAPTGELPLAKGTSGNAYLLPDGRVVDADVALYKPDVLAQHPERAYEDFPGE